MQLLMLLTLVVFLVVILKKFKSIHVLSINLERFSYLVFLFA